MKSLLVLARNDSRLGLPVISNQALLDQVLAADAVLNF